MDGWKGKDGWKGWVMLFFGGEISTEASSYRFNLQMDKKGELTGDDIAYIYPDMRMALKVKLLP